MRILILSIIIFTIGLSCKQRKNSNEFYVLSYHDSLSRNGIPPPPTPPGLKYYSNIVMIFDTSNNIYLYQVDIYGKNGEIIEKGLGQTWCCGDEEYPFFLDLTPNDLITINANYFIDFIKDNDCFFRLDTNYKSTNRFLYLVSDFDTIKNKGFYELLDYIKTSKNEKNRVYYIIRGSTEEERQVLKYKRSVDYYDPKSINWSENFLDGKTKPFTLKYDSLEKRFEMIIKKRVSFKENALRLAPIK